MARAAAPILLSLAAFGCGASPAAEPPPPEPPAASLDASLDASLGSVELDAGAAPDAAEVDAAQPDAGPPAPDAAAARFDDPGAPGPYLAGVKTFELHDPARSRTFSVDVWYPVDPANADGSDNTYRIEGPFGVTLAALHTPARRDATPLAGRNFPLVLFSHGYGGVRFQSFFFTEHLATHGFVVASPDHPGNTLTDFARLGSDAAAAESAVDRPLDVNLVLERMLLDGFGAVTVDPARIAMSGHSFGAWTALEVARRDPRIRVVVPMAPGFRNGVTPDFVAGLQRPLAIFGGSADRTCEFEANQLAPYQLAATPKALVEIMGAGHFDFSDMCELAIAHLFVKDGCDPSSIDPAAVRARVNTVATAFLRRYLGGESAYDAALEPAAVTALGQLQYWSEY